MDRLVEPVEARQRESLVAQRLGHHFSDVGFDGRGEPIDDELERGEAFGEAPERHQRVTLGFQRFGHVCARIAKALQDLIVGGDLLLEPLQLAERKALVHERRGDQVTGIPV